jgi:hypothetical protein
MAAVHAGEASLAVEIIATHVRNAMDDTLDQSLAR